VFPIFLPSLKERRDDIPLLVSHFVGRMNRRTGKQIRGLSPAAMRMLMAYEWPGNVRELENAVEHAFVLCNRKDIEPLDLPVEIRQAQQAGVCPPPGDESIPAAPARRQKLTRAALVELLDACDWNKAEAARRAGVSRTAVWKYMKKWKIPLQQEKGADLDPE
jgi:DNA-binding NtrC family response regulator